ncbi:MAG: 5'/3'-nucleotidase SurE [Planctomycetota bacterium]|nr:5'/3'-nucleotidase SurE [Planctomycetota bacterium]
MRILLTNDDGIGAAGLKALHAALSRHAEVWVVAPRTEQSAIAHAITLKTPISVSAAALAEDGRAYSVAGTPADCVKLALCALMTAPPDVVVSGINHGANAGVNVLYSGTLAAAVEAALNGVPAVAASLETKDPVDFAPYAALLAPLIMELAGQAIGKIDIFNVNCPFIPVADIGKPLFTYQACSVNRDTVDAQNLADGSVGYTLRSTLVLKDCATSDILVAHTGRGRDGKRSRRDTVASLAGVSLPRKPVSDIEALRKGHVSVTPISFDRTDYGKLIEIAGQARKRRRTAR